VFTPEPWQGYGFDDESKAVLAQGKIRGKDITYGDTHHPAISETEGDYGGKYLFINDKANPRVAVIDLHDIETKQIVVNPFFKSEHGGAFVTTNTEYVMEGSQYAAPLLDDGYVPLEEFNDKYRGGLTYWKFNREKGRIEPENSFVVELGPYSQDLSDAGKKDSYGWGFTNSFCSERYVGGIERGRPPFEAGCSSKDTDYLHVTNWKKAEELVKAGKVKKERGMYYIPMEQAVAEGLLYLIPEPKSPHGVDVAPDGKYLVALNKLAIDRFNPVGPLHPQNHQLIDISGDKMQLLYDMPLPLGEPHYVVAIQADKLKPGVRYKSGWDSLTDQRSPCKARAGREKTERTCDAEGKCTTEVLGTVIRSHITPEIIEVEEGDTVKLHLTNLERAEDEVHGFALYGQNVQLSIEPGKTASATFVAGKPGVYPYYCTETIAPSSARPCTWRCKVTCWSSQRGTRRPRSRWRKEPFTPRTTTTLRSRPTAKPRRSSIRW